MKEHRPHLLTLKGDARRIGFLHGKAAREANALSAMNYYARFVRALFGFRSSGGVDRALGDAAYWLLKETVGRNLIGMIPRYYRDMILGFSEGGEIPEEKVLAAYIMPDLYAYLLSRRMNWPNLGCTSFVRINSAQNDLPLIHGRNLDYPGGEVWNQAPAIIEYEPDDGQRYAAVTSLGIDAAGVTGMNESGICTSLHLNYSSAVKSQGIPIAVLSHEVIRRATSIGEAVKIIRASPRTAGWSMLISSFKEATAVKIEFDAASVSVHPLKSRFMVMANHYEDTELKSREYWVTRGREMDTQDRLSRAHKLLAQQDVNEDLTIERAVGILSDSFCSGDENEQRFGGGTIAQVHTVSSVVFDPSHRRVYVGSGPNLVPKTSFHAFDLFPGPSERDAFVPGPVSSSLDPGRIEYVRAHEAYFPSGNFNAVAGALEAALRLDPMSHLYWTMLGLVRGCMGDFQDALAALTRARELPAPAYRAAQNTLYLARVHDVLGERSQALELYAVLRDNAEFNSLARAGIARPWKKSRFSRLYLDFTIGDAIQG